MSDISDTESGTGRMTAADASTATAGYAVRVTADRVLCEMDPNSERTSRGGILIPATAESKNRQGVWAEVVDVGPLVRSTTRTDKVLFLPDSAIEVDVHGTDYLIVRERDIHAVASTEEDASNTGLYL
ncbi:GroES family chaperonin [Euzebya tangerina]|uniref:GroES family chaperonin n=1 Tax=Euzebya tangerina TaxID=591198 RepID=UPI001F0CB37E|nr:co-chaperone GroES [Euzebya tangerina]